MKISSSKLSLSQKLSSQKSHIRFHSYGFLCQFLFLAFVCGTLFGNAFGQCVDATKTKGVTKGKGGWVNYIGHTLYTTSNRGNTRLGVSVSPARSNGIQNVTIQFWHLNPADQQLESLLVDDSGSPVKIERCLTPEGTKLRISEVKATAYFRKNTYKWIGKAVVTLFDGDTMLQNDHFKVEFFPQEITPKPKPKDQLPMAVAGTIFEGAVKKSEGDIVLDDDGKVVLRTARIVDGNNLEIGFDADYLGFRRIDFEMKINGKAIRHSEDFHSGSQLATSINLALEEVPRFESNQLFGIKATLNLVDGETKTTQRTAAIMLPVVIVPGIASTNSDSMAGDGEFKFLEYQLKIWSGQIINNQTVACWPQNPFRSCHMGEGYRMINDGGYWTLSTLRYARNRSTMAEGAEALSNHIEEVVRKTYAQKVYLITHSYGGLISRKYIQAGNGKNRVAEFIQAQAPNMGSMWAVLGQKYSEVRGFGFKYFDIFPLWETLVLEPNLFSDSAEKFEKRNLELAQLNGIASSGNYEPFTKDIPYTMIYSRYSRETLAGISYSTGSVSPTVINFYGDDFVPAFSQLGLYIPPKSPSYNPISYLDDLDNLRGKMVPALENASICKVEFNHSHTYAIFSWESWNDFKNNYPFTDYIPFISLPKSREELLFLEKPDVMEFLWFKRLSKGVLSSASSCPTH